MPLKEDFQRAIAQSQQGKSVSSGKLRSHYFYENLIFYLSVSIGRDYSPNYRLIIINIQDTERKEGFVQFVYTDSSVYYEPENEYNKKITVEAKWLRGTKSYWTIPEKMFDYLENGEVDHDLSSSANDGTVTWCSKDWALILGKLKSSVLPKHRSQLGEFVQECENLLKEFV